MTGLSATFSMIRCPSSKLGLNADSGPWGYSARHTSTPVCHNGSPGKSLIGGGYYETSSLLCGPCKEPLVADCSPWHRLFSNPRLGAIPPRNELRVKKHDTSQKEALAPTALGKVVPVIRGAERPGCIEHRSSWLDTLGQCRRTREDDRQREDNANLWVSNRRNQRARDRSRAGSVT